MTFAIDTGFERPAAKSEAVEGLRIRFTDWTRADRNRRQVIEAIESCESPQEVDSYLIAEADLIDALLMFDYEMGQSITNAAQEHRAIVGACPSTAAPCTPIAQTPDNGNSATKGNSMFDFDTGSSGSDGPWVQWSARGTQDGSVPAKTFFLREEGGTKTPIDSFNKGVVLDITNMKTGWQRSEGITGQAPDWKWNASIAQMAPQPGDDYKKGLQIRCALGGGKAATWEQAGAAVWNAFVHIVPALQQGPGDGSLPLVRLTSVKEEKFARGSTTTPLLEIVKWVPRPDCLKEGTAIATEPAPTAPAAPAAPTPAQTAAAELDDAGLEF